MCFRKKAEEDVSRNETSVIMLARLSATAISGVYTEGLSDAKERSD